MEEWSFYVWRYSIRFTRRLRLRVRLSLIQLIFFQIHLPVLIFKNQPNLATESGIHPSLNPKCRQQIILGKFNLTAKYPPLCERLNWDYQNVDISSINRATDIFYWGNSSEGKNFHQQVNFVNKIIMNVFHNYIPNNTILCNAKVLLSLIMKLEKYVLKKMRYSNSI